MMIDQNKNTNDENLVDHKLFIGFVDPEMTEVEIVLFSIIKMAGNKYQTVRLVAFSGSVCARLHANTLL